MWQASLELEIARVERRSVLVRARHAGPLRVQRPFYPESHPEGACHIYVLHPPGGVVGGDSLELEVQAHAGARGLLTTPAATKFYRSQRRVCRQRQHCKVAPGAALEWLPQENIFFEDSWSRVETRVELDDGACFIGWEIGCLGRPAAGEGFGRGTCIQRWEIYREGSLIWMESNVLEGGSERLGAPWGMAGFPAWGTLVCVPAERSAGTIGPELASRLRDHAASFPASDRHGVTWFGDVLVCRYLGHVEAVKRAFGGFWSVARPFVLGHEAVPPRIWAT
jgi:urease accessory protein